MTYREALQQQMEEYYQITAGYRAATMDATRLARKPGLFKKQDYSPYIQQFMKLAKDGEALNRKQLQNLAESDEEKHIAELFSRNVISFILLCEENARFYDLSDKKQYRKNGVTLQEYAECANRLQGILDGTVKELEKLEQAYKEYFADNFTNQ